MKNTNLTLNENKEIMKKMNFYMLSFPEVSSMFDLKNKATSILNY